MFLRAFIFEEDGKNVQTSWSSPRRRNVTSPSSSWCAPTRVAITGKTTATPRGLIDTRTLTRGPQWRVLRRQVAAHHTQRLSTEVSNLPSQRALIRFLAKSSELDVSDHCTSTPRVSVSTTTASAAST